VYVFDTDVMSLVLRKQPPVHLIRRLATVPPREQFTTAITLGEIVYGAARVKRPGILERAREAILSSLVVLPFDAQAAERYGVLRAALERLGTPLAEPDLRIAAIALEHGFILVTGKARHFTRVPDLVVEDWTTPPASS
jgi:tRNA(fMet)-specific endonuclease VapC